MAYKLRYSARAIADIDEFAAYLADINPALARDHIAELEETIDRHVVARPLTWNFFFVTGAPYRAYLFRVSRRNAYWIVYRIDEDTKTVNVIRFWQASRAPESFEAES